MRLPLRRITPRIRHIWCSYCYTSISVEILYNGGVRTSDFDYHLPIELIGQSPMKPRDWSRLMVVSRSDGSIQHRHFFDLPEYLCRGDVLVFNDTRVIPARLHGRLTESGGKVELLLLNRLYPGMWRALVKPGRRMRSGAMLEFDSGDVSMTAQVLEVSLDGTRIVRLSGEEYLHKIGVVPLPPYIHEPLNETERYQTVYSRVEGSVAAPTAGLHFTEDLLERVLSVGAETIFVTLHVGWDSFRPVKTDDPSHQKMHSEYWNLGEESAKALNKAKRENRRIITIGTTATRLLEHVASMNGSSYGMVSGGSGWADLFILPGYEFKMVDALVTNFHLPRSSLLMLVSAFAERELIMNVYQVAIERGYRFYSFGDAMLIL